MIRPSQKEEWIRTYRRRIIRRIRITIRIRIRIRSDKKKEELFIRFSFLAWPFCVIIISNVSSALCFLLFFLVLSSFLSSHAEFLLVCTCEKMRSRKPLNTNIRQNNNEKARCKKLTSTSVEAWAANMICERSENWLRKACCWLELKR